MARPNRPRRSARPSASGSDHRQAARCASAPRFFPAPAEASAEGLLCIGGALSVDRLLDAYRHGIFPWPVFADDKPIAWWSPDPRAVIEISDFRVPRRLKRTIRNGEFVTTLNRDFPAVIRGCASAQEREDNTWLTPNMISAYIELHQQGHAHSLEVWQQEELAAGIYGVAIGGMFAAESKFYRVRDASKVALVALVAHLEARGYTLLDIQQMTEHSRRFGATEIPRPEFLERLQQAIRRDVTFLSAPAEPPES